MRSEIDFVESIIVMIYTGLRPSELLDVKCSDVDLEKNYITGGIKTVAGKDRIIPINKKILEIIESRMAQEHEYLFVNSKGVKFEYSNYLRNFDNVMKQLSMKHKPHDARHTFATLMANAKADTVALQKIIGHASYVTTANVYTHKDLEQLQNAVDLI
jgi:integrase